MPQEITLARIPMAIAVAHIIETEEGRITSAAGYWSRAVGARSRKQEGMFDNIQQAIDAEREKAISWFAAIADREGNGLKARTEARDMVTRLKAALAN